MIVTNLDFREKINPIAFLGPTVNVKTNGPHLNIFSGLVLESKGSLLKVTYSKVKVKLLVLAPIDVCFTISLKIY